MDLSNKYLKALKTKDKELFKSLLHKQFGYRTLEGHVIFDLDHVDQLFDMRKDYEITLLKEEINETKYLLLTRFNRTKVLIKLIIKDELIFKAYEVKFKEDYRRVVCHVQYDGSEFYGFQRQKDFYTVQGEFEKTLKSITNEEITIHSSGRTDAGVHAYKQVLHFDTKSKINPNNFYKLLNKFLPKSIFVSKTYEMDQTFHSRYDVEYKQYLYKINTLDYDVTRRNYEWHLPKLNVKVFQSELMKLIGTHDFTSFTKTDKNRDMVRTIYSIDVIEKDGYVLTYIKGNGFLRYMVRNIIGAAVRIASGRADYDMNYLLTYLDNNILKDIAPSKGLYLNDVNHTV